MTSIDETKANLRILQELHEGAPGRFFATLIVALVVYKTAGAQMLLAWSIAIALNEGIELIVYQRACVNREPPARWQHMMEANFIWGGLSFGAASLFIWIYGSIFDLIFAFLILIGSLLHTIVYFAHSRRLMTMMGAPAAAYMALMPAVILYRERAQIDLLDAAPMILGVAMFLFYFIIAALENSRATRQLHAALRASRRARTEAESANATKSIFLANTSHEIRTPLNGVMGMAQALARSELTAEQRQQVDAILSSGAVLTGVLNDVLDLSKIEAGRMEIARVPTDLRRLLDTQRPMWAAQAEEKGLEFSMQVAPDVPTRMMLDPIRLRQCIGNLVSNALKFTENGEVVVSVSAREGPDGENILVFEVSDTGIGINTDQLDAIFTPFTQADSSINRRYGGTGLGLSVTRQIARLSGGDVKARRRATGGACFTLTMEAEALAPSPADTAHGGAINDRELKDIDSRLRVLVVDDTATNRMLIRMLLKGFTARVVDAENGLVALQKLEEEPFDLVLLDIHMPVMNGRETLRCIRASDRPWANVRIIALTADAMEGDRDRYLAMGMDGYATKPIDQRALATEIYNATQNLDLSPASRLQAV